MPQQNILMMAPLLKRGLLLNNDLEESEEVIYQWRKNAELYTAPVDYRYVACYSRCGNEEPRIDSIVLQEQHEGRAWITQDEYISYTPILNILHLIENATGKKVKGSFT